MNPEAIAAFILSLAIKPDEAVYALEVSDPMYLRDWGMAAFEGVVDPLGVVDEGAYIDEFENLCVDMRFEILDALEEATR